MNSSKFFFPCLVLMGLQYAASAQPLENILVTGTYSPRTELTSSVSVLDAHEIASLDKRHVADLLKTLPGLLVEEQGGPGGLTSVSIRGGEANFTVVLLDGVPVNDPTNTRGGSFDFGNLNTALVERIEVVRGAQSAIYGSDALAGVINIVTRRPEMGHRQSLRADVGEDDYYNLGGVAQGRVQNFDYTLELATRDDGNPVPGSRRNSDSANLRAGWEPALGHRLTAGYRYLDGERKSFPEQSGGPVLALNDDLDQVDYEDEVLSLSWRWAIRDAWQSQLSLSRFEHTETFDSPGIPPFFEVPPNGNETDFTRDQAQWVNTLQVREVVQLNLGGDYRREEGDSAGYVEFFGDRSATDYQLDRDVVGVFAHLTASPLQRLLMQGSVRYDDPEGFDSETSWQAGSRWAVTDVVSVALNWGQAFKLPSFFALGNALVGNPDLQPEQSESWDAGVNWSPLSNLSVGATIFFNDFKDLVDFDDASFRNVNRQNVESQGVELQSTWSPRAEFSLRAQATYTDIDVKGEDTVLTGRPEWTAGLVAQWRISEAWDTVLDYQYTGRQWSISRHTGAEVTEKLDDYHRVDWVARWHPVNQWQFRVAVDNLLDERYETAVGFEAPSRALRVGVVYTH
ncbi:MAG: TonB-dependent receptor [Pseudomonadota bacterium]